MDPTLSVAARRVRDLPGRPPVTATPDESVRELATRMTRAGVGSVVIVDRAGAPVGIVTDRDLRRKVVAEGRDPSATAAAAIMSAPLDTVQPDTFLFEALLLMTRREIHHLPVVDEGRLRGVVSSGDVVALPDVHPVTLTREIARAESLDALRTLPPRVTDLVRRLVTDGVAPYDVGTLVAELNDRVTVRVLALVGAALASEGLAPPPEPYVWLAFGSEARREQTLYTDQDNGLAYADPVPERSPAVEEYYTRFGEAVGRGLVHVGFPPCPGGIMASNPAWRLPLSGWEVRFRGWLGEESPDRVLQASIFFDLRPIGGERELGAELRRVIEEEAPGHRRFLSLLARDVVDRPVPLTVLGHLRRRRSGPHRGTVDIKGAGAIQLVGAGRLHALALGLPATNTVERFREASVRGRCTPEEAGEIVDAYQHLLRLRLVHQLGQLAEGAAPDNHVDPDRLSHADGILFREALRTVGRVQSTIRERYATDFVT